MKRATPTAPGTRSLKTHILPARCSVRKRSRERRALHEQAQPQGILWMRSMLVSFSLFFFSRNHMPFAASPLPTPLSPARGPSLRRGAATAVFTSVSAPQARACTPALLQTTAMRKPTLSSSLGRSPIGIRPPLPQQQQNPPRRRASSFAATTAASKKSSAAAPDLPEGASADIRVIAARAWKVLSLSRAKSERKREREKRREREQQTRSPPPPLTSPSTRSLPPPYPP